ncbi:ATP-binding protein [Ramlibacter sp.]|uniref:sensor histidine kinase n=1 Tax=Ramlibacter sp. TaxID=1917967 RepID=UPI00260AC5CC|nr:ATP-binding protein [Ramlibacter sp.]MDB5957273.1 putative histidine kinase, classic [Ramlibacter sp.]
MTLQRPPEGPPRKLLESSRAWRWAIAVGVAVVIGIGIVLMFLLTQATNNRELYERNYGRLFVLNMVVAGMLLAVIVWVFLRLASRLRRGKFGSRLLVKLAAIFALVGLVPGVLIYTVSYQFVSRSIESWFDVKVEGALDAGLNLGRTTLDTLASDFAIKARTAGNQLADSSDAAAGLALERIREQLAAVDVVLWSGSGQMIASTGQSRFQINPERPTAQQLRNARSQRAFTLIEGIDDPGVVPAGNARIKAIVLVPQPSLGLLAESRFLQATVTIPPALVANAIAVQEANREYQERALGREGLRRMYIGTLTLTLFLAVFGAVLLAIILGNQLARPLLLLAAGVSEVAAGDLSPKPVLRGKDELGGLTRSFAEMTQQLADARAAVEKSMDQVSAARANVQTILDNLTAGVIVLDREGRIQVSNPGASRTLRLPLELHQGLPLAAVPGLEDFGSAVQQRFDEFETETQIVDHWQQPFELNPARTGDPQPNVVTLVARGASMPGDTRLLVLDDISEIVSAQRAQAWGEVARRLAHEIKNPLTPIQLSAERLEMKLASKLADPERALLAKSVHTIVDQVESMKRLVNEFRDYARLPAAELKPVDLNALVNDVLHLYAREGDAARGTAHVPVRVELDPVAPRVLGDPQQLRQVIHNLLQNAQDATEGRPDPQVVLRTQWSETSRRVRLVVQDNGSGFPEHILKRAFEPYVTTKAKGTGLGLAVVKKIADEHGARIDVKNRATEGVIHGAQVSLSFRVAS